MSPPRSDLRSPPPPGGAASGPAEPDPRRQLAGDEAPDLLLSAQGISVRFGGVLAVNNVSFDVRRGEVFTLIGPNGAGKTTVFNLISRLYTPSAGGRIVFDGADLLALAPHEVAQRGIARTFQNIELFEHATVLQNLLIGRHTHRRTGFWQDLLFTPAARRAALADREQVERVIDFLDLAHHRDTMIAALPYGVRKVVELARALALEPRLLMLDEPSSGLNVEETDDMAWWIDDIRREFGITVLMVEHDMSLVSRVSDRVLAMNQGEVLALGSPAQVQADARVVEAYLGSTQDLSGLRREAAADGGPGRDPAAEGGQVRDPAPPVPNAPPRGDRRAAP